MHKILREILHLFKLTSCQLSVNMYRLIHSVIKLAEVKMIKLKAFHLFENYMMSRNLKYSQYFLCTRRGKEKIIAEGMYDSEKWPRITSMFGVTSCIPRLSTGGLRYRHVGESRVSIDKLLLLIV